MTFHYSTGIGKHQSAKALRWALDTTWEATLLNSQEATTLRERFEQLPKRYILKLEDIDLVPAVLGRGITWSYTESNGVLNFVSAYGQQIRTVEDLSALAVRHPRTNETDTTGDEALGKAIADAIVTAVQAATGRVHSELVWMRLRYNALLEILEEKNPGTREELAKRSLDASMRDWEPYADQLFVTGDDSAWSKKHAIWLEGNKARLRASVGVDAAERIEAAWDAHQERIKQSMAAAEQANSSIDKA